MTGRVVGRLGDGGDLVTPAPGDSVLAERAVVAMCTIAVRSTTGAAALVAPPRVATDDDGSAGAPRLRIGITVVGAYGADLPALAADVRRSVARTVTAMTGLEVTAVDVDVTDVAEPGS